MTLWRMLPCKPGTPKEVALHRVLENVRLLGWDVRATGQFMRKKGRWWAEFVLPEER